MSLFFRCVVVDENLPRGRGHEAIRWGIASCGKLAHLGTGNEQEVIHSFRLKESHLSSSLVVRGDTEGKNFQILETWGHGKNLLTVRSVKHVTFAVRMAHSCRVPADNVVLASCVHACLGVPLDFGRASIEHGAGENAENGGLRVEDAFGEDALVLVNTGLQRDIVALDLAANLVDDENGVLEAA